MYLDLIANKSDVLIRRTVMKNKKFEDIIETLIAFFNPQNPLTDVKAKSDKDAGLVLKFINTKYELSNKLMEYRKNHFFRNIICFNELCNLSCAWHYNRLVCL